MIYEEFTVKMVCKENKCKAGAFGKIIDTGI